MSPPVRVSRRLTFRLKILFVTGLMLIEDHQVYHQAALAPIGMRQKQFIQQAEILFALKTNQQNRVIA
jgi:hypothetical protein